MVAAQSSLRLDPALPVEEGLPAAFAAVLAYGRGRAAQVADEPVAAVHELRKSVRRARSLLRFCEAWMDETDARALRRQLKRAFDPTSALRDGDVLGGTLAALVAGGGRASIAAGKAAADAMVQGGPEVAAVERIVAASLVALEGVEAGFAAALRAPLGADDLPPALSARYRATREARADAAQGDDLQAVHEWRKRAKELRYSLELLEPRLSPAGLAALQRLDGLARELGGLADLLALRAWLKGRPAGVSVGQRRRLRRAAAAAVRAGRDAALASSADLFAPSPDAFAAAAL